MATTTNYGWTTPDDTALVKDGASAIRTLGTSVDTTTKNLNPETTLGDVSFRSSTSNVNTRLGIGTTGQVLTVASGVPSWATPATGDIEGVTAGTGISGGGTSGTVTITNSMATAITTAGDLIKGTGSGTFDRLGIGSTGQVLTVASGIPSWATPSGAAFSGASVHNSGTQSISTGTETIATFNSEYFDTDAYHSTSSNTGRLTIPAGKSGKYLLIGRVWFDVNGSNTREMRINKNGSLFKIAKWLNNGASCEVTCQISVIIDATAADYYELTVSQYSGSTIALLGTASNTGCNQFDIYYLGA
jgi:hypothetical protein